jgi:hypothetical protein
MGVSINGGSPIAGWFISCKIPLKGMMKWDIPILGNPHINIIMGSMRLIFTHKKSASRGKYDLHLHTMFFLFLSLLTVVMIIYPSKKIDSKGPSSKICFFSPTE